MGRKLCRFKLPYWTSRDFKRNTHSPQQDLRSPGNDSGVFVAKMCQFRLDFFISLNKKHVWKSSSTQFTSYSRSIVYSSTVCLSRSARHTNWKIQRKKNLCETRTWSVVSFSHSAVLSLSLEVELDTTGFLFKWVCTFQRHRPVPLLKKTFQRSYRFFFCFFFTIYLI